MKDFWTSLRRQEGFTLVELMVVVAIIGLLSAVAIPNFKKYQAKSKISEAKLQLSALYTAEAAFFSDYNMYGHCLSYMGFDPSPERLSRYYAIGFEGAAGTNANAQLSAVNSGLSDTECPAGYAAARAFFPGGKGVGAAIADAVGFLPAGTTVGDQASSASMTFLAGAGGVIDGSAAAAGTCSKLTINQAKIIGNVQNGY